jgi:hypothetical protein
LLSKSISLNNPFRPIDIWDKSEKLKYLRTFKDFCIILGGDKYENHEYITNIIDFIHGSSDLIDSFLDKSQETKVGQNYHYYFIAKIENETYLAFFAKNYRGKKLEKGLNQLMILVNILRNNCIREAMNYIMLISDI